MERRKLKMIQNLECLKFQKDPDSILINLDSKIKIHLTNKILGLISVNNMTKHLLKVKERMIDFLKHQL